MAFFLLHFPGSTKQWPSRPRIDSPSHIVSYDCRTVDLYSYIYMVVWQKNKIHEEVPLKAAATTEENQSEHETEIEAAVTPKLQTCQDMK